MRFSQNTLEAAKKFGPAILSGAIFNTPKLIEELYDHFLKISETVIAEFVEYLGKFLSNEQLFQLVECLLGYEGHQQGTGGILRTSKSLCKYLFTHEVRRNYSYNDIIAVLKNQPLNHQQLLNMISLPEVVMKHFKSKVVPVVLADNQVINKAECITYSVLFVVFQTPVSKLLMDSAENAEDIQIATNQVSIFKNLLNVPKPDSPAFVHLEKITEMRTRVYQAIDQCALPQETALINSVPFAIDKFTKLTDALLRLINNGFVDVDDEKFNAVWQSNDVNVLAFALKKLEPVSMLDSLSAYLFPASTAPVAAMNAPTAVAMSSTGNPEVLVSALSSVKANVLNMENINEGDSIDNIRSRYIVLVTSIKQLVNTGIDAANTAMKNSSSEVSESDELPGHQEYCQLREKLMKFGKLKSPDIQLLHANGICALTQDIKSNIDSLKSKLPTIIAFTKLHECLDKSLENIVAFESSCQRSNNPAVMDEVSKSLKPHMGTA